MLLDKPIVVFLEQDMRKGAESNPRQGQNLLMDNINWKMGQVDAALDWTGCNDEDR